MIRINIECYAFVFYIMPLQTVDPPSHKKNYPFFGAFLQYTMLLKIDSTANFCKHPSPHSP